MKSGFHLVPTLLFAFWPGLVFGSVERLPNRISLNEAISKALSANPEITQASYDAQSAHHAVQEAHSGYFPRLSLMGQYSTSDDIRTQLPDSNQAVIRLDEDLFEGGRMLADLDRLHSLEGNAMAQFAQKQIEIVLTVKESYIRGVAALEQVNEWDSAKNEYTRLLRLIEPKFTVGSVPEYDYAKVRISLVKYEQERLKAAAAFGHELYILGAAMGSAPPTGLLPLAQPEPPPAALDSDTIVAEALSSRPDLKAGAFLVSAADFSLTRAKRERIPTLKLSADYGYSGYTANTVSIGWGFTAQLSFPLFDFGLISSHISQAASSLHSEESKLLALKLKVRTDIHDIAQDIHTSWASMQAAKGNVSTAQRAYLSSLNRYRTDIGSMTELSDAHDLWVESRITLSQATSDFRIALARLEAARGYLKGGER